jgi:uncharacterized protein
LASFRSPPSAPVPGRFALGVGARPMNAALRGAILSVPPLFTCFLRRMVWTRETHWRTIALFLVVQPVLVLLLLTSRVDVLIPIARATHWIVHPDLVVGGILLLVVVGGIVLWHGGFRATEVGLVRSHLPLALLVTAAFWLITQLVLVLATLTHTGALTSHAQWSDPGTIITLGYLAAMLFGMALYEEVAYRGDRFPQLYLKLRGACGTRVLAAAVLSAVIFGLLHVPTRILIGQVTGAALLPHMAVLTLAGLFGVILYLGTENLLVVTGIHALVNAPTQVVAAPTSPIVVTVVLSGVMWLAWSRLVRSASASPPGYSGRKEGPEAQQREIAAARAGS